MELGIDSEAFADKYGLDWAGRKELGVLLSECASDAREAALWANGIYRSPRGRFLRLLVRLRLYKVPA